MSDAYLPLVVLTRVGDLIAAQVLAARLQSEGVAAVVKGEPMGPYPVTVGRMAVTEILVPEDEFDSATELLGLLGREADTRPEESTDSGGSTIKGLSGLWWLVAAGLLAMIIWARLGQFL